MISSRGVARILGPLLGGVLTATLVAPTYAAEPAQPQAAATSAAGLSSYSAGGLVSTGAAPGPAAAPVSGFGQLGNCTFYATSSLAGGYCASTLGYDVPASLRSWLDGRPFVYCRFEPIPEGMALEVKERPGGYWVLKICIQDVDFSRPWGGTDTRLEVYGQWIPDGRDIKIPGYMEEFWDIQGSRNYYPLPRILVGPTQKAVVNAYTYYWAQWVESFTENTQTTEPFYRVPYRLDTGETVYLRASISDLVFHPGRPAMEEKACGDATTEFRRDIEGDIPIEEGGTQPSECWFRYDHSSANNESGTVQVRATAEWEVDVVLPDGAQALDLGGHAYEITQRIPIAEVQSNVDSDPNDW